MHSASPRKLVLCFVLFRLLYRYITFMKVSYSASNVRDSAIAPPQVTRAPKITILSLCSRTRV